MVQTYMTMFGSNQKPKKAAREPLKQRDHPELDTS